MIHLSNTLICGDDVYILWKNDNPDNIEMNLIITTSFIPLSLEASYIIIPIAGYVKAASTLDEGASDIYDIFTDFTGPLAAPSNISLFCPDKDGRSGIRELEERILQDISEYGYKKGELIDDLKSIVTTLDNSYNGYSFLYLRINHLTRNKKYILSAVSIKYEPIIIQKHTKPVSIIIPMMVNNYNTTDNVRWGPINPNAPIIAPHRIFIGSNDIIANNRRDNDKNRWFISLDENAELQNSYYNIRYTINNFPTHFKVIIQRGFDSNCISYIRLNGDFILSSPSYLQAGKLNDVSVAYTNRTHGLIPDANNTITE